MADKRAGGNKGEGGVYEEPDGTFRAIVYIGGRPVKRRAATREAAETLRRNLVKERDQGIDVGSGGQALEAWLHTWQDAKARKLSLRSRDNNRRLVDGYIVPLIGRHALNRVKASQLQDFLHRVQDDIVAAHTDEETGEARFTGGRTVGALAQVLRSAFRLAVQRGIISRNPMDGVEIPRHSASVPEPLSDAQLTALLSAALTHPLCPLWHLYGLLGLRRGEGMGVCWGDIDLDQRTIRIAWQVQHIPGQPPRLTEPKNTSIRTLPLPGLCVELLRVRKLTQMKRRAKRADTWQDLDLVFCSRDGKPLWPRNVTDDFYALCRAAGVPETATLHSLRHTVTTILDEEQVTDALKAGILGHGKKTVTHRYAHARMDAMRRALDKVAARAGAVPATIPGPEKKSEA